MGLKRFSNAELTSVIKAAGTLQFDDDMLLDRTSQQLMLSIHKMSAEELYNLVCLSSAFRCTGLNLHSLTPKVVCQVIVWLLATSPGRGSTQQDLSAKVHSTSNIYIKVDCLVSQVHQSSLLFTYG